MPLARTILKRFVLIRFFLAIVALLSGMPGRELLRAQHITGSPEQALKVRVQEFYTLLHTRQYAKAEAYATKDSRERLRDQASNPFLGFRVISAEVNPDGQSAKAKVELTLMTPYMAAPMPYERTTEWRLEEGEWRIVVPEPPPVATLESMMAMGGEKKEMKPEQLQFKGHTYGLGVMKPGEVKAAAFPFTNVTDHSVRIAEIVTGCDCLKVKTEKMEYQPGESGELVIEFDSTNYEYEYLQSVKVRTQPDDVISYLKIYAEVVPRNIAFPEKKEAGPETRQP